MPKLDWEPPQPQRVRHHADAGEAHGGGGEGGVEADAEGGEGEAGGKRDEEQVVAEGPGEVLADRARRGTGEVDEGRYGARAAARERRGGCVAGHVGAAADGDADICGG